MNVRKRGLALLMCICMIFTLLPFSAFADKPWDAGVKVEFWCTNSRAQVSNTNTATSTTVTLTDGQIQYMSELGFDTVYEPQSGLYAKYWKTVVLNKDNWQTTGADVDKTYSGTEITAITKLNGTYRYYTSDSSASVAFNKGDQIVRYYKLVFANAPEYGYISGSDWGYPEKSVGQGATYSVEYKIRMDNGSENDLVTGTMWYHGNNVSQINGINCTPDSKYVVSKIVIKNLSDNSERTITDQNEILTDQSLARGKNYEVIYYLKDATEYELSYSMTGDWESSPDNITAPAKMSYKKDTVVGVDKTYSKDQSVTVDGEEYSFSGWCFDTAYSKQAGTTVTMTDNITLYGHWTKVPTYTVTYNKGDHGNLAGQNGEGNVVNSNVRLGSTTPAAPEVTADSGYYFTGWEPTVADTVTGNATYTAQYAEKTTITVVANSDTAEYNGSEHSVNGFKELEFVIDDETYTVSGLTASVSGIDANDYVSRVEGTAVVKNSSGKDVTERFTVKTVDGELKITPKAITLTGDSATRTYTGSEIELTGIDQSGLLDGHTFSGVSYSAKGTNASATPYPGMFSDKDKLVITDAAGKNVTSNYNVEYKPGALIINPIGTVTVTITGKTDSKVYNGQDQTVSGYDVKISDPKYTEDDFTFSGNSQVYRTDVGTTYMGLKAEQFENKNSNFDKVTFVIEDDGYLTITKRPLTIEGQSSTPNPITYDGETHSFTNWWAVTATDDTGLVSGHEVSGISYLLTGKDADSYTGAFTGTAKVLDGEADVTGNYEIEYALGEMLINPAEKIVIKITGNTATETYDGNEKSVTGYTTDVQDSSITVALKEGKTAIASGTNVGKYMMGLEEEDFVVSSTNNYEEIEVVVVDGYLEITPITDEVVVTITGNKDEFTYDGEEHTVKGYDTSISNQLYKATDFTFNGKAEVSRTDVGTSDMGLKNDQFQNVSTNFTNVKFVVNDGSITIKERPYIPPTPIRDKITVEITGNSDSVVYDGAEHSVKDYTVKISDSRYTEKDFTFSGTALASGVNAGTYEMGLKADQFKNTNARFTNVEFVIKADGALTITQRPLTITAGSAEGIAPVTSDEYTVEGLATGDKVDSVKLTGVQSEPGESPNVASDAVIKNAKGEDVTANYKITYVDGVLKAIEVLNKEIHFNYVIGYTDGTIRPDNDISRAEVATIFFRLLTDEAREQYTTTAANFTDVKDGMWCNRAIATLTNMGIIKGYTDGSFQPNKSITRAELATIIARFAKLDVNTKTFSDINGHWAQKNIELAAGNGWINGYDDGTFRPNNNITRAETFAMINRVLDRQTESVSDLLPTSDMNMWSDNMDADAWYYKDVQEATNYHKCDRVGDSVYETWTEKVPDIDWASYQI